MSEEIEVSLPSTRQGTGNEVFGIDLGTTYSAIAWLDSDGRPVIIQNVYSSLTQRYQPKLHLCLIFNLRF